MPFPASDVVMRARDEHPAFTEQVAPDPVLFRALTDYARELRGRVVKFDPDVLLTEETIALPLANFAAGHTLTNPSIAEHGGDVVFTSGEKTHFDLIDWRDRNGNVPRYSGWLRGGDTKTLFLVGEESMWNGAGLASIVFLYVPVQPEVTAGNTSILLPDRAIAPLRWRLASMMARRVPADSTVPVDKGYFAGMADQSDMMFKEDLVIAQRTQESATREVW